MGKTIHKPPTILKRKPAKLTREQQRRLAGLRKLMRERDEAWARLTPAEQEREEREWEQFKKSVNEERARIDARPIFID